VRIQNAYIITFWGNSDAINLWWKST